MAREVDNRPNEFARVPEHKNTPAAGAVPAKAGSRTSSAAVAPHGPNRPHQHTDTPVAGKVPGRAGSPVSSSSPPQGRGPMKQHVRTPAAGALPTMHEHADALHPVKRR